MDPGFKTEFSSATFMVSPLLKGTFHNKSMPG